MFIKKAVYWLLLIFIGLVLSIFLLILINSPNMINSQGSKLMCENTLKMIAKAVNLYQAEWDGQWPPSLLELGPYYEGIYSPGPNRIPDCPGDRNEKETHDSSKYYYYPPKTGEIVKTVPVCWDSKPHYTKLFLLPDTFLWTVLYSDGHVERVNKKELFKELSSLSKTNPDVLKVLPNFTGQNNEGEK